MSGDRSRLALVLSGGGSKGALQVGLYRALCELEIRPDLIVGSSVGALNGALIAADCTLRRMRERYGSDPEVLLLQPDLGERIEALDFSQGAHLAEEGYRWALPRVRAWIEASEAGRPTT